MPRLNAYPLLLALIATAASGCATYGPDNPSFDLTVREAWHALDDMADLPRPAARPVVLLAGWLDPGHAVNRLEQMLSEAVGEGSFISVHFAGTGDFDRCRERIIAAVDAAYPSDDPVWTTEVDVVAISMGGLVARYAAADPLHGQPVRRLRIARLFTISTPHQGADLAVLPATGRLQMDMRADSAFLQRLAESYEDASYTIYPYVRLGDRIVGPPNTAPGDEPPLWLPNRRLEFAHLAAYRDPRILADIARRLRHEPAFANNPRAPLP